MKKRLVFAALLVLCTGISSIQAQPRGGGIMSGGAVPIDAVTRKLFGENTNFSANVEVEIKIGAGNPISMPGKIAFDRGNSRVEMDISKATGMTMPPEAVAQLKTIGMDIIIAISRPDKKIVDTIYPGMKAYAETALPDSDSGTNTGQFTVETTELGKETVGGHACVKNKVVVTDDKGTKHESTAWNATDMKNFPIKLEKSENGNATTMVFKEVKIGPAAAGVFDAPADFTKYDNVQTMMMQEMSKRRGGK